MDVILFETVQNLGGIGDTVRVKPGYARNFLIPHGKAVPATPENLAALQAKRAELEQQEGEAHAAAQTKLESLIGLSVTIPRKAGEEGKLFGSVGTADLVEAIGEAGVEITRHDIQLPDGVIRNLGEYDVEIRLHSEVETQVHVHVVAEGEPE